MPFNSKNCDFRAAKSHASKLSGIIWHYPAIIQSSIFYFRLDNEFIQERNEPRGLARVFDNRNGLFYVRRTYRQPLGLRRVYRGLLQIASGSPAGRAIFLNVGQISHRHRADVFK